MGRHRADYDWDKLRLEWALSGKKLRRFCHDKQVNYSTALKHIDCRKRDEIIAAAHDPAHIKPEVRFKDDLDRLRDRLTGEDRPQFLAAAAEIVREVMLESHGAFLGGVQDRVYIRPAEMARVTLNATEQLRAINSELQGVAPFEDREGFPILRGFEPHWYQRDFVFDWPSNLATRGLDTFIMAMVAGIGTGKTKCGARKMGKLCELNRGLPHGVYAPTYRMLEDATKREFLAACSETGIQYRHMPSQNIVELWGDTPVFFRSMDNPDHLRGPTLAAAWIDEALQMPTREAFDVIMGRLRHPDTRERCVIFTGTPDLSNAFNWAYDILVKDGVKNRVRMYSGRTRDNISLAKGVFDFLETLYDAKVAKLELEGQFIDVAHGRAYYNFSRVTHVLPAGKMRHNPEVPLILMVDFNVHPMHWVIGQSYPVRGDEVTYIFDELYVQTTSTEETAREFCDRYGKHRAGIKVYGDAAGRQRHTSATRTDYEIINQIFEARGVQNVELHVGKSNPMHGERVKDVNARLRDAKDNIHLYILESCAHVIEDFERQGVKPGTMQLDKTNLLVGHGSDAVGYYVNREHALRRMKVKSWSGAYGQN